MSVPVLSRISDQMLGLSGCSTFRAGEKLNFLQVPLVVVSGAPPPPPPEEEEEEEEDFRVRRFWISSSSFSELFP